MRMLSFLSHQIISPHLPPELGLRKPPHLFLHLIYLWQRVERWGGIRILINSIFPHLWILPLQECHHLRNTAGWVTLMEISSLALLVINHTSCLEQPKGTNPVLT